MVRKVTEETEVKRLDTSPFVTNSSPLLKSSGMSRPGVYEEKMSQRRDVLHLLEEEGQQHSVYILRN